MEDSRREQIGVLEVLVDFNEGLLKNGRNTEKVFGKILPFFEKLGNAVIKQIKVD